MAVLLIHGYSDNTASLKAWRAALAAAGFGDVRLVGYKSLVDEIHIGDIAEAFDLALRKQAGLDNGEAFDAIVHSTGMLVVRAWLARYAGQRTRLKRLIGLAPATFGSPLAHKGRSFLGAVAKGNRELGPDFGEAGTRVLDNLELASPFTWELAHRDLVGGEIVFGPDKKTPWAFVFCGNQQYSGLRKWLAGEPGTDGTVRWAGCALNSRKVVIDLSRNPEDGRFRIGEWRYLDMPLIPIADLNHGTILEEPTSELVALVVSALKVENKNDYDAWLADAKARTRPALDKMGSWQQFVVRVIDERGDPVPDYYLEFFSVSGEGEILHDKAIADVHAYEADKSYRCLHIDLKQLDISRLPNLWLRVVARSGTELVEYRGYDDKGKPGDGDPWVGSLDLGKAALGDDGFHIFYPFTTTLVEIVLNREPVDNRLLEMTK